MDRQDSHQRYARQMALPGFGPDGQHLLLQSRVAVVGCGGLGNLVAMYLSGAGVGRIALIEPDRVEWSNLNRQIAFSVADLGAEKVRALGTRLLALNPEVNVDLYPIRLDSSNVDSLLSDYDIVADCTDDFDTRRIISESCGRLGKPLVSASADGYEGEILVFPDPASAGYDAVYALPPDPDAVGNCATRGVSGPVVGIAASIQSQELIRLLVSGPAATNAVTIRFDAQTMDFMRIPIRSSVNARDQISGTGIVRADQLSGNETLVYIGETNLNPEALHLVNLSIPSYELLEDPGQLSQWHTVVLVCNAGKESSALTHLFRTRHGMNHIFSLAGGIFALKSSQIKPV